MEYRTLGRTGLRVSRMCLGSVQFGWQVHQQTAFDILDEFVASGGNFIDTANIYSIWHPGHRGGEAETIIGRWLRTRGRRDELIVATKVGGRMWEDAHGEGLSRKHIMRAVEDSLRRLQTDYIDLYQAQWFDPVTPIEETLRAFDDLVCQGKVRYVGACNFPAWRVVRALWSSDVNHWVRFESLQVHYNIVHREEYERELQELCREHDLGVIAYGSLGGGLLTGKYEQRTPARWSAKSQGAERRDQIMAHVRAVAEARGVSMAQVALRWLLDHADITSVIVSVGSVEELHEVLRVPEWTLAPAELEALDEISAWQ